MSVYRQIYQRVRASIEDGSLRAGDRLPSTRALAGDLGVARGTVDTAYALLSGEGYVVSRGRGGTIVSPDFPPPHRKPAETASATQAVAASRETAGAPVGARLALAPGLPSFDQFPRKLWSRLVAHQARRIESSDLYVTDPQGDLALRTAIAAYLGVSRGINCTPDRILVTGGYQAALGLLLRLLAPPGASVWIEDPGYPPTRRAIAAMGISAVTIPVDRDGMDLEPALGSGVAAAMCIVTPAHQFPLGVSLALRRRLALLDWAKRTGAWILEDDYDSEFRHGGRALPALKSLDGADRVFYVGTFSKTLFPGLRLGYVVAPASQVAPLLWLLRSFDGGRPSLEQRVVAAFLAEGHFGRHLKRMRSLYDARRAALSTAITESFGPGFRIDRTTGGLQLVLRLPSGARDIEFAAAAGGVGLWPLALSRLSVEHDVGQGLLIGFGNTPESQAKATALRLRAAMNQVGKIGGAVTAADAALA